MKFICAFGECYLGLVIASRRCQTKSVKSFIEVEYRIIFFQVSLRDGINIECAEMNLTKNKRRHNKKSSFSCSSTSSSTITCRNFGKSQVTLILVATPVITDSQFTKLRHNCLNVSAFKSSLTYYYLYCYVAAISPQRSDSLIDLYIQHMSHQLLWF